MSGYVLPNGDPIELGTRVRFSARLERVVPLRNRREREWRRVTIEPTEGVVAGVRTLWDGVVEWDEGLAFYWTEHQRALLVAFHMARRPVFARPEDVEVLA